jgi:hypothetical protein
MGEEVALLPPQLQSSHRITISSAIGYNNKYRKCSRAKGLGGKMRHNLKSMGAVKQGEHVDSILGQVVSQLLASSSRFIPECVRALSLGTFTYSTHISALLSRLFLLKFSALSGQALRTISTTSLVRCMDWHCV